MLLTLIVLKLQTLFKRAFQRAKHKEVDALGEMEEGSQKAPRKGERRLSIFSSRTKWRLNTIPEKGICLRVIWGPTLSYHSPKHIVTMARYCLWPQLIWSLRLC